MSTISDFKVGMKVVFGRGNGEQTLGEVVKVNRAKLKIKQLESRGTMRSYPVGTIWTVPPSLCRPADGSASTAPAPTPMSRPAPAAGFKVGDRVEFDNAGKVITGTVKRVNGKTISVTPDGADSRYWRVSPRLLRPCGSAPAAPATTPTLKVGQTVEYRAFSWKARGVGTVQGVITKVDPDGTYEIANGHQFSNVVFAEVKAIDKRSDTDIVIACLAIYGALSPENLHMDGEASRSYVRSRYAQLQRALKALWKEAGREISESECYRAYDAKRATR